MVSINEVVSVVPLAALPTLPCSRQCLSEWWCWRTVGRRHLPSLVCCLVGLFFPIQPPSCDHVWLREQGGDQPARGEEARGGRGDPKGGELLTQYGCKQTLLNFTARVEKKFSQWFRSSVLKVLCFVCVCGWVGGEQQPPPGGGRARGQERREGGSGARAASDVIMQCVVAHHHTFT